MQPGEDVRRCSSCGALSAVLVAERVGVTTFYCTDCEFDWDEEQSRPPDEPTDQEVS
jgi:hypothetical protein